MIVNRKQRRGGKVIGGTIVRRKGTVGQWREPAGEPRIGGVEKPAKEHRPIGHASSFGKKWIFISTAVLLLAGVAGGGAWLWQSPYFEIKKIEVEGASSVSDATILEKTALTGESMFEADLGAAQRSLMTLPLVKSVQIERDWPSTVRVVIEERQGWGTWEQAGIGYTIDREGVVISTEPMPVGAPVIKAQATTTKRTGDRVDYQAVDAAAEIYQKLPQALGTSVNDVSFVAGKGVQVTTADGQTALFGDSSSIAYKLAVWAAMAREAKSEHISYTTVDLRFGNRPVLQ